MRSTREIDRQQLRKLRAWERRAMPERAARVAYYRNRERLQSWGLIAAPQSDRMGYKLFDVTLTQEEITIAIAALQLWSSNQMRETHEHGDTEERQRAQSVADVLRMRLCDIRDGLQC